MRYHVGRHADAGPKILENPGSPLFLNFVVQGMCPPTDQRFLVAPGRERKHDTRTAFQSVSNIVDEAIQPGRLRAQKFSIAEICVPLFGLRLNFKMTENIFHQWKPPVCVTFRDEPCCPCNLLHSVRRPSERGMPVRHLGHANEPVRAAIPVEIESPNMEAALVFPGQ